MLPQSSALYTTAYATAPSNCVESRPLSPYRDSVSTLLMFLLFRGILCTPQPRQMIRRLFSYFSICSMAMAEDKQAVAAQAYPSEKAAGATGKLCRQPPAATALRRPRHWLWECLRRENASSTGRKPRHRQLARLLRCRRRQALKPFSPPAAR